MKKFFGNLASSSTLWGLVATFVYYFSINAGIITNGTLTRYSTGHPVEYATLAMFWIGAVDLAFKLARTRRERRALRRGALFPPKKREKESLSTVEDYLGTIAKAREVRGDSTHLRRLAAALNFLKYGGSPDDLDQELRALSEDGLDARDSEYGMVRTFVWAIPILGFLGTVLGITTALGNLDLTRLEATGEALSSGLKVAFDTTALALSLVFVVYFLQFYSRKKDAELEDAVRARVDSELKGRFRAEPETRESELEATRKFMRSVVETFASSTRAQVALWKEATEGSAERFGEALDKRLASGSAEWSKALANAQREFVEETARPALEESARSAERLEALESAVGEQVAALGRVIEATAEVATLEERLTRTLEKIAEVGEFEKTLSNLSATVCLLNSKLASSGPRYDEILSRRTAKRDEALAALDSLESALGSEPRTLTLREFDAEDVEEPGEEEKRSA